MLSKFGGALPPAMGMAFGVVQSMVNAQINRQTEEELVNTMRGASDMILGWVNGDSTSVPKSGPINGGYSSEGRGTWYDHRRDKDGKVDAGGAVDSSIPA